MWYCSREHQTGHWKQHKKVCKATDAVSVRCREVARFLAEEPVDSWQTCTDSFIYDKSCYEGPFYESLIALGACETLVARMSFPCESRGRVATIQLSDFFCRLSSIDDGARRLSVTCTYHLLAKLFSAYLMDIDAIHAFLDLVVNLLSEEEARAKLLSSLGPVVEGVLIAMRAHTAVVEVAVAGTVAVSLLAETSRPDVLSGLLNAGAVEVLNAAMLAFPEDRECIGFRATSALGILQRYAASIPASVPAAVPETAHV